MYAIQFGIEALEGSPRFQFDENTLESFEKVRVEDTVVFGQRVRQTFCVGARRHLKHSPAGERLAEPSQRDEQTFFQALRPNILISPRMG
jgi:hypothetical protein